MMGIFFLVMFAIAGLAFWLGGPAAAAACAIVLGIVAVPSVMGSVEYVASTHDS
jgi:hypothetical protein